MKKNLFKKITAVVLSLTMVAGLTSVVSARANNGENVALKANVWKSFSVCDGGEWEDALIAAGQVKGQDYATEGWITEGVTNSKFDFYVKNTGWDGEWNEYTGDMVADCPWGLTATMEGIPVENNRYYTISFKIKRTIKGTYNVNDEQGNELKDEEGNAITKENPIKHVLLTATSAVTNGGSVEFISTENCSTGGYMELDANSDEWTNVSVLVKVPAANVYKGTTMNIQFVLGSMWYTYENEMAQSGYLYVDDFKVTAGVQHKVTFKGNGKSYTRYVNDGETIESINIGKKKYTMTGYKNTATGSVYNFNSPVTKDLTLEAQYTKTKKPAKAKISSVKSKAKRKAVVTLKKTKNAVGYQIKYSNKRNMKSAKTKITKKAKYTIKKLKSGKIVYVQVRAYVLDSTGQKVYGKWSTKKRAYVK